MEGRPAARDGDGPFYPNGEVAHRPVGGLVDRWDYDLPVRESGESRERGGGISIKRTTKT